MTGMTETSSFLEDLFGPALDVELVMKSMPDQADVHVNEAGRRNQARAAFAANAFGATMGGLAIKDAVHVARTKAKLPNVPRKAKIAAGLIAAGQIANVGGDANSMVVTGREATRKLTKTGRKKEIAAKRSVPLHPEIKNLARKVVRFWKPPTVPPVPPAATAAPKAAAGAAPKNYAGNPQTRQGVKDARKAAAETQQKRETGERASAIGSDIGRMGATKSGKVATGSLALIGANKVTGGRNRGYEYVPDTYAYGKADTGDLTFRGEFTKFDDDKRQAFGWASVVTKDGSPVLDRQGDYISIEDLESAAYTYVHKSRVGGDMHRRNGDAPHHVSDMIESMVFTPEKIAKMGLPEGFPEGWWVGYQIHDEDTWQEVRKKGRTGFSIHGRGIRKDIDMDDLMGVMQ